MLFPQIVATHLKCIIGSCKAKGLVSALNVSFEGTVLQIFTLPNKAFVKWLKKQKSSPDKHTGKMQKVHMEKLENRIHKYNVYNPSYGQFLSVVAWGKK